MGGSDSEQEVSPSAAPVADEVRSSSQECASGSETEADSPRSPATIDESASEQSAASTSDAQLEPAAATAAGRESKHHSGSDDGDESEAEDGGSSEAADVSDSRSFSGSPEDSSNSVDPSGSPGSSSESSSSESLSSSLSAESSGSYCLWELCCAPDSELAAAVIQAGAEAQRLTLETGFDLQFPRSAHRAQRRVAKSRKFPRGWASPPCTKWSSMQNLTKKNHRQKQDLKRARRKSGRSVGNCVAVLLAILRKGGHFYYEWPHSCQGWHIPELGHLRQQAQKMGHDILEVVFEGCAFGLRDSSGEYFLRKKWRVLTNDPGLPAVARRCPFQGRDGPGHQHKTVQGAETARSAFYPPRMCRALARHWQGRDGS